MDWKFGFRIAMIALILLSFYTAGVAIEAIIVLGILFIVLLLLKGKLWKTIDKAIEKHLPFTKKWPEIYQKILFIIIAIIAYLILKQILYFALSLAGIDLQKIILESIKTAGK